MKDNLKDILANLNAEVDQQTLLKYLEGKLTAAEQHDVEKNTLDEDFQADALEGLQHFTDKAKIASLVEGLNQELKKKTAKKKKWPHKREAKIDPLLIVTIVIILVIAVVGYLIFHKMKHA